MSGANQAVNLSGMLSGIADTLGEGYQINGMNAGQAMGDNVRRTFMPTPDYNDPKSLAAYAQWAKQNGRDEEFQVASAQMAKVNQANKQREGEAALTRILDMVRAEENSKNPSQPKIEALKARAAQVAAKYELSPITTRQLMETDRQTDAAEAFKGREIAATEQKVANDTSRVGIDQQNANTAATNAQTSRMNAEANVENTGSIIDTRLAQTAQNYREWAASLYDTYTTDSVQAHLQNKSAPLIPRPDAISRAGALGSVAFQKLADDTNEKARDAGTRAVQARNLFENVAELEAGGGTVAEIRAKIKKVAGTDDEESYMRMLATQLRNSQAIANLPPGVASDKDVEMVLSGELDPFSSPENMKRYAQAIEKLAREEQQYYSRKASWIAMNSTPAGFDAYEQKRTSDLRLKSISADEQALINEGLNETELNTFIDRHGFNPYDETRMNGIYTQTINSLKAQNYIMPGG